MDEKVNVAELLRYSPKGIELDCTMLDNIVLEEVDVSSSKYPIVIRNIKTNKTIYLTKYGQFVAEDDYKCVIFPKGKTTWEGFQTPFKDGDVVTNITGAVFIYKEITTYGYCGSFVSLDRYNQLIPHYESYLTDCIRLSTEEEKEKLFKAIKDNGYRWNADTKTLVELIKPKFKVGDWITINKPCQIISINDNGNYIVQYCDNAETQLLSKNFCESHFHLWTIQDAKDGDVLFHSDSASNGIFIFKEISQRGTTQKVICYCDYDSEDGFCLGENHTCCWADSKILHPATKEKRDILFQKMKKAGYEWKPETKTLDALIKPKFNDGDILYAIDEGKEFIFILKNICEHGKVYCYLNLKGDDLRIQEVWLTDYNSTHRLATEEEKLKLFKAINDIGYKWNSDTKSLEVLPKFKVGDYVTKKGGITIPVLISRVGNDYYYSDMGNSVGVFRIKEQDDWELVPNKFDINTLKPFEGRVLVRDDGYSSWRPDLWALYDKGHKFPYITIGCRYRQCIPYEGNEHLLGKTDDCSEYYKNW